MWNLQKRKTCQTSSRSLVLSDPVRGRGYILTPKSSCTKAQGNPVGMAKCSRTLVSRIWVSPESGYLVVPYETLDP